MKLREIDEVGRLVDGLSKLKEWKEEYFDQGIVYRVENYPQIPIVPARRAQVDANIKGLILAKWEDDVKVLTEELEIMGVRIDD